MYFEIGRLGDGNLKLLPFGGNYSRVGMRWGISQDPSRKQVSHLPWVIKENMKIRLFVKFRDRIKELPELMKHTGTGTIGEPFQSQARMAKGGSFPKMWTSGSCICRCNCSRGSPGGSCSFSRAWPLPARGPAEESLEDVL